MLLPLLPFLLLLSRVTLTNAQVTDTPESLDDALIIINEATEACGDYGSPDWELIPISECDSEVCTLPATICRYNFVEDTLGCWDIPEECQAILKEVLGLSTEAPSSTTTTTEETTTSTTPTTTTEEETTTTTEEETTTTPEETTTTTTETTPTTTTEGSTTTTGEGSTTTTSGGSTTTTSEGSTTTSEGSTTTTSEGSTTTGSEGSTTSGGESTTAGGDTTTPSGVTTTTADSATTTKGGRDWHSWCCFWAGQGECDKNVFFMRPTCQKSCGTVGCRVEYAPGCAVTVNIEGCPYQAAVTTAAPATTRQLVNGGVYHPHFDRHQQLLAEHQAAQAAANAVQAVVPRAVHVWNGWGWVG